MDVFAAQLVSTFVVTVLDYSIISASTINIPYDVAKSRIQSIEGLPGGKYHGLGCHTIMSNIAKNEGFLTLFAGLNAKLLRLCPAGGVMMMMNELVYDYLTATWPLDQ